MASRLVQTTIAVSLIGTLSVGIWLRWWLVGVGPDVHDFGAVRHLHTHLGYYGVLFPLMWLAWSRLGLPLLPVAGLGAYAVATATSAVGFGLQGYGPLAIAGSTGVLAVWIWSAWRARSLVSGPRGWLRTVPLAIVLGAALVPLVAKSAGTDRAAWLVRSFLGLLMLGALLPTALAVARARPLPTLGWFGVMVAAGLSLGAVQWPPLRASLLVVGLLVGLAGATSPAVPELRVAWALGGVGMATVGMDLVPLSPPVAVAGTHFLVLGPLAIGLWPEPLPRGLRLSLLGLLVAMCTAIVAPVLALPPPAGSWAEVTAVTGTLLGLGWLAAVGWTGVATVRAMPPRPGGPAPGTIARHRV